MNIDGNLEKIISGFEFAGELIGWEEIKTGHINRTYRLSFRQADGSARDYVLQNINTFAFKKPDELMENVRLVTEHLREAMVRRGEDPENRVLRVVPALGGGIMLLDGDTGPNSRKKAQDMCSQAGVPVMILPAGMITEATGKDNMAIGISKGSFADRIRGELTEDAEA